MVSISIGNYNLEVQMISCRPLFYSIICGLLLLAFAGCDNDGENGPQVDDVLIDVRIGDIAAEFVEGTFPEGDSSVEVPVCGGSSEVVRGGAMVFQVNVSDSTNQLLIGLDGDFGGYYAIDVVPAGSTTASKAAPATRGAMYHKKYPNGDGQPGIDIIGSASSGLFTIIITTASDEDLENFILLVSSVVGDVTAVPCTQTVAVNETAQSSDELQVSLNWNAPVDMDLHVETPDENDIYYGAEVGQNGGTLDLDSNAGCSIDNVNNENITWGEEAPACGEHIIRVDLWSACDQTGPFEYAVTVNEGGNVQTFQGSFDADDETGGGAFDGRVITSVDVCG